MIHIAAKAMLGPILFAQAFRLRRSVIELPEASGARSGVAGTGTVRLRLLIAGDSAAAGVGAATQDEALAGHLVRGLARRAGGAVRWQLVARTGARSEDVFHLLKDRNLRKADIGVVLAGVNDISKQVSLRRALRTRDEIAALMQERAGVEHVVFSALPEMEKFPALPQPLAWYAGQHARHYNEAQARWLAGRDAVSHASMEGVMDPSLMAGDGFHPGPRLYAKVAQRLAVHIIEEVLPGLRKGKGAA
ncbi:MAG TPA: SGNH/GDSL hydrolase family protein [Burkholderiaceae bacterium]|nr:SGNH/GDSL hydrolase family protein [Burkholderiaceae bacterium]